MKPRPKPDTIMAYPRTHREGEFPGVHEVIQCESLRVLVRSAYEYERRGFDVLWFSGPNEVDDPRRRPRRLRPIAGAHELRVSDQDFVDLHEMLGFWWSAESTWYGFNPRASLISVLKYRSIIRGRRYIS